MNAGKRMEQNWRKSCLRVPRLYYKRMNDGTATFYGGQAQNGVRFQKENPYDCFMFLKPNLYLIELKSHKGSSLPINAIRGVQLDHLSSVMGVPGIVAGFVVHFQDKEECYFAEGWRVKQYVVTTDRKSIPIAWFRENGTGVGLVKKITNTEYDVKALLWELETKEVHNGAKTAASVKA